MGRKQLVDGERDADHQLLLRSRHRKRAGNRPSFLIQIPKKMHKFSI
nr:MAG TPA: hypothetical protein [Caudoviricetes sp.]